VSWHRINNSLRDFSPVALDARQRRFHDDLVLFFEKTLPIREILNFSRSLESSEVWLFCEKPNGDKMENENAKVFFVK
jgi:hypothetical protein